MFVRVRVARARSSGPGRDAATSAEEGDAHEHGGSVREAAARQYRSMPLLQTDPLKAGGGKRRQPIAHGLVVRRMADSGRQPVDAARLRESQCQRAREKLIAPVEIDSCAPGMIPRNASIRR